MTLIRQAAWIAASLFSIQTFAAIPPKSFQLDDPNPNVRIKLKGITAQSIELIGSEIRVADQSIPQTSVQISRDNNEWVVDSESQTFHFATSRLPITGKSLFVEKVFVPPSLTLVANREAIDLIAILPLETYLEGVVASEIPDSWPHEAQKAQAIAARTFTLNKLKERRKSEFDVEASVMDQVFKFKKLESLNSSQKAVRETRGLFVANSLGIIEPIFYHASCGGATDGADKIFGQPVSRQARNNSVKDSCALNTKSLWQVAISQSELFNKLKSTLHLSAGAQILGMEAEQTTLGGRATKLAFNTTDGKQVLTGETLRALVGYSKLKSTRFSVMKQGENFVFTGKGLGHGVGLCQWGARDLAQKGKTAGEILHFYFPYLQVTSSKLKL